MSTSYFILKMLRKKRSKNIKSETPKFHSSKLNSRNMKQDYLTSLNKCRICLKEGLIPIYGANLSLDLPEAIRTFGDVEIYEHDELPKYICEACQSLLNSAILFRKSAKSSDRILRNTIAIHSAQIETNSNHSVEMESYSSLTNIYNCKSCNLEFRTLQEYSTHRSSKEHRKVRVLCQICHRLLTPQLYQKHMVRHQSATHLVCEVCGKLYRKDNLFRHLQLHSYDLPYQCQVCPYRGRFMDSLKIHMRTHSGVKPFACNTCELRFVTRSNLNRHILTHKKDKPHKCLECGRGFYTKSDMDLHFKSDHAGIKDFCCRICGNKYATKKAIMRHELRVHKRTKMPKGRMPLYLQEEYRKNNID